ncbi:GntR family transcriptional regulator [Paraburkholderia bryophila]|jgi:DNA-binding GntR family transcriptional regulator|uniref:GntR family transcriptional regulator n=1 Tax=Paraburkholderia bryophila TaxID=420952 RepID=A0A329CQP2_9BURK|nr:GntR family transcriptional regulator [Paraburkholderia bryophila]RAS33155.1 GntR family transcriptional regulator [Paraburkholderia bryophila]
MARSVIVERHAAPLRQQVVRLLREQILDGELAPGERLLESALCNAFGVSRTVIREALRQLESEHLVTVIASIGPIVTVLTQRDIESIYQVRQNLEGLAGMLFAVNATDKQAKEMIELLARMETEFLKGSVESRDNIKSEFYELLLEGGGNKVLAETMNVIHGRIAIFRRYAFIDEARVAISMNELRRIIDAVAVKRDADLARNACEEHVNLAGKLAIQEYERRLPQNASVAETVA